MENSITIKANISWQITVTRGLRKGILKWQMWPPSPNNAVVRWARLCHKAF